LATDADEPAKRRNRKPGGKKMEKEIKKTEREETKRIVVEKYLEECDTTIDGLKEKIARMSIDYTGTLAGNYSLLLRGKGMDVIWMGYYRNGDDGCNNHDRFWFEFSLYFYRDLPSGCDLRETDEDYEILDGDKVVGKISPEDLKDELVDDLVERNEGKFNEEFEEFLEELYTWIVEVD